MPSPSALPPARALRELLRTPATTRHAADAIDAAMTALAATFRTQADTFDVPEDDQPLLLQ